MAESVGGWRCWNECVLGRKKQKRRDEAHPPLELPVSLDREGTIVLECNYAVPNVVRIVLTDN